MAVNESGFNLVVISNLLYFLRNKLVMKHLTVDYNNSVCCDIRVEKTSARKIV